MHEIKIFFIGLISGISLTLLIRGCKNVRRRLHGAKSDCGSASDLNEQAGENNRRIEELEQQEAGALEEAERDNQAAVNLLEKAKHILNKHNNSSNSSNIDTNL